MPNDTPFSGQPKSLSAPFAHDEYSPQPTTQDLNRIAAERGMTIAGLLRQLTVGSPPTPAQEWTRQQAPPSSADTLAMQMQAWPGPEPTNQAALRRHIEHMRQIGRGR